MNICLEDLKTDIQRQVSTALEEDIRDGDITAQLIPFEKKNTAEIITRESCILCGRAWLEETFKQLGGVESIRWLAEEGQSLSPGAKIVSIEGNTRILLTGERTALNFMQFLSGIATKANEYAKWVSGTQIRLLDTRKTIPGLRRAQKYAVAVGGCDNHRIGLYDAFLIKENHIAACGSITAAIEKAKETAPTKPVEIEVENLDELKEATLAKADIIMLDNFSQPMLEGLNAMDKSSCKYELSGNLNMEDIPKYLNYNIDYMSFGALTKNVRAVDLSMRIVD